MGGTFTRIIKENNLQPGDMMKNVVNEDVDMTLVLGPSEYLIQDFKDAYTIVQEHPLTGSVKCIRLSKEQMKVLQEFNLGTFGDWNFG